MQSAIGVQLEQADLWAKFKAHGTEMIVTKVGRLLFPKLAIRVSGLDPNALYGMHLKLERADQLKYRYSTGCWSSSPADCDDGLPKPHEVEPNEGFIQHGHAFMAKPIEFSNFKVTNNCEENSRSVLLLQTLHKYVPVIYIFRAEPSSMGHNTITLIHVERLHLAEFITVTAYQSEAIKELKKLHNPFAKGERSSNSVGARKRQAPSTSPQLAHNMCGGEPPSKMMSPAFPTTAMPMCGYPSFMQQQQHQILPFPSPSSESSSTKSELSSPDQSSSLPYPEMCTVPNPFETMPHFPMYPAYPPFGFDPTWGMLPTAMYPPQSVFPSVHPPMPMYKTEEANGGVLTTL